jgi:hypothetical protein
MLLCVQLSVVLERKGDLIPSAEVRYPASVQELADSFLAEWVPHGNGALGGP